MNDLQARLLSLAPPPTRPIDAGTPERWGFVETLIGTVLPRDYKWIINTYGRGDFCDLLALLNPFSTSEGGNLLAQIPEVLDHYREGPGFQVEERRPFPAHPEPGGLLPAAQDSNGGDLFWRTLGEPDSWALVHYDWRGGWIHREYGKPLLDFLVEWISGELPDGYFGVANDAPIIRRDPIFLPTGQSRPRLGR